MRHTGLLRLVTFGHVSDEKDVGCESGFSLFTLHIKHVFWPNPKELSAKINCQPKLITILIE